MCSRHTYRYWITYPRARASYRIFSKLFFIASREAEGRGGCPLLLGSSLTVRSYLLEGT